MKKKDIIQLVKEAIKETTFYGNRHQRSSISGLPGVMEEENFDFEDEQLVNKYYDDYDDLSTEEKEAVIYAAGGDGQAEEANHDFKYFLKTYKQPFIDAIDKMYRGEIPVRYSERDLNEEMTALGYPKGFIPTANKFHQELVGRDTDREFKRIKDDPRSGMLIFVFPYMEGPSSPSLFGRETSMALEASKARAKAAAQKTVDAFKDDIIDYEIASKSPAGVDAQIIYLYVMFKDRVMELFGRKSKPTQLPIDKERLRKVFDAVNNSSRPEFFKNVFKGMYRIPFPENFEDITEKQALKMNMFMNDMKNKIKEGLAYELEPTGGGEKELKIFKNKGEADAFVKAATNIKKAVPVGASSYQENLKLTNDMGKDDYVDDEGRYAKSQLYKMAKYAVKLHQKLDDMEQLPAWLQSKITKASDYMSMVYHYLDYEMARRDGNLMQEMDRYKEEMLKELTEEPNEGNAFAVARLKAIKNLEKKKAKGEKINPEDKKFTAPNGEKKPLTNVSDDDIKAAKEL